VALFVCLPFMVSKASVLLYHRCCVLFPALLLEAFVPAFEAFAAIGVQVVVACEIQITAIFDADIVFAIIVAVVAADQWPNLVNSAASIGL